MSDGKQLSSSSQQIIVWEGEWPQLKSAVRQTRIIYTNVADCVGSVFDFGTYKSSVVSTAKKVDDVAVTRSKQLGVTYRNNPWIVPAAGIAGVSAFVFAKSTRWGLWASTRNSLVTATVLAGLTWPHEIRRSIANKMYRSAPEADSNGGEESK